MTQTALLGELAQFISGFAFKSSAFNVEGVGMPLVRIRDVVPGKSGTYYSGEYDKRFVVEDGDYLIGMDGEFNLARWRGGTALLNQRVCKVADLDSSLDRGYLGHFLPKALKAIEDVTPFATVKHLSVKSLRQIEIPLPPLDEQRRIAAILDHADALRSKRRQALTHLDDLTQSIFLDMFGGEVLTSVSARDLMPAMRNGLSPSTGGQCQATVLTLSAVTRGLFDPSAVKQGQFASDPPADKRVSRLDFLMCRGNGNKEFVGVGTFSREDRHDLVFPDTVIAGKVDPSLVTMAFLEAAWRQQGVRSQIEALARTTNGTYKVNQQTLATVEVPLPPLIGQREFATRAARIEAQRAAMETGLTNTETMFASLQYKAFRGGP